MLSNCVNGKNGVVMFSDVFKKLHCFRAIKLFECQKNIFGMPIRYAQDSIAISDHKQYITIQYNIHDTKSCELPK